MLTLGKISAGPAAAAYYTDQVASGVEDYYDGEGEAPGRWVGSGATAAGLDGQVEAGQLELLLAGGGLRQAVREGAVAGFDLTFRAPKSVSVLWGVADQATARQLGEAHDAAVAAALGYMEREACRARRGKGGAIQVRGGGFVAAAFRHRASRAGDPLLHTHVITGNLTEGPDGRWTALDARHLSRHAKTAGFLYQAELRREVTERLGLAWGPVENGTADIEGVERGVVEHFSQRRREILERMAEHGGRSAQSAQVAALETRRAKQEIRGDRLRELWRARAAEHGLTEPALTRLLSPGDRAVPFVAGVESGELTRTASVFGRPELLQALAGQQTRGATIADLEQLADAVLADHRIVGLPKGTVAAGLMEPRFTTQEQLALEHDLIHRATGGVDGQAGQVRRATLAAVLQDRSLSAEQQQVVRELCERGDRVSVVRAAAGTGKTFVLDAAREAWQREGLTVHGTALSARAALELSDQAAIASMTIAQLTLRLDAGQALPFGSVLVVDEAGMVGTRDLARLAVAAETAQAKLVLVGDDRQLPEIAAGGAFHALAEQLPVSTLREVRRQHEAWDRRALDQLRSGEIEQWARAYRDHGRITVGASATSTRTALINDWAKAAGDRLIIAARREDVAALNHEARALLQNRGELGPDQLVVAGRGYTVGDRVIGARNDRRAGILNGQGGSVDAVNPDGALDVRLDDGTPIRLDRGYLEAGHLEHGYAITAHRAQGATVDRTFVLGSEELYREWGYTALSRHRHDARFYVARTDLRPDPELPRSGDTLINALAELLQRSNVKHLAIDQLTSADRDELERDRRALRQHLQTDRPPRRMPEMEKLRLQNAAQAVKATRAEGERLQLEREQLRRRDRGRRAELDAQIQRNAAEQRRYVQHLENVVNEVSADRSREREWTAAHAPDAARLLAADRELRTRDAADSHAAHRLERLDAHPLDTPARDLKTPDLGLRI